MNLNICTMYIVHNNCIFAKWPPKLVSLIHVKHGSSILHVLSILALQLGQGYAWRS